MAQLVIRDCGMLNGRTATIVCENDEISEIILDGRSPPESDRVIEGGGFYLLPGLVNTHTHAPMSILRGIGEDLQLDRWLNDAIWPLEGKMTLDHLKAGMRLACLEMIRTGTTTFNDMYFREGELAETVSSMGLRAVLGEGFIDMNSEEMRERNIASTLDTVKRIESLRSDLITTSICPHAAYTVSEEGLIWCKETADDMNLPLHIHLSETADEVARFRERHGTGPVKFLDGLGFLKDTVTAAHCVHLDDPEIDLLASRGVKVSHNPISNMKLSSGGPMRLPDLVKKGVDVSLGTDGAASNNSLDMFRTMKTAGLLSKHAWGPGSVSTSDILKMASGGINGQTGPLNGCIRTGMDADLILLDRDHFSLNPPNDVLSNIVYSAAADSVRYTIVAGRVIMENGRVQGDRKIIEEARSAALHLVSGGD
ncbi:MAG: amidohydrolase [Thermoplasmatota archaeon]